MHCSEVQNHFQAWRGQHTSFLAKLPFARSQRRPLMKPPPMLSSCATRVATATGRRAQNCAILSGSYTRGRSSSSFPTSTCAHHTSCL